MKLPQLFRSASLMLCASSLFLSAATSAIELKTSGFLSVIGGQVTSGDEQQYGKLSCPCFIADYVNAGVYEDDDWSFSEESKLGLRGEVQFTPNTAIITQVVTNGGNGYKPDLAWLYFSQTFNDEWTLNIGRKRIPLFAYSDMADVGYALPWMRVPPDSYGWAVESYNGASIDYLADLGSDATLLTTMWLGEGEVTDHKGYELIYYWEPIDIKWSNMIGISTELTWSWLTTRLVYMNNDNTSTTYPVGAPPDTYQNKVNQDFYGISMNADYENWMIRTEYSRFEREQTGYTTGAFFGSIGYRIGNFLPAISWSRYSDGDDISSDHERHEVSSLSLRWDFIKNADIKFQYDAFKDKTNWGFVGNAKAASVGVDYVF